MTTRTHARKKNPSARIAPALALLLLCLLPIPAAAQQPSVGTIAKPAPKAAPTDATARQKGLPAVQLYDLAADLGETKNLHEAQPAQVERLRKLLEKMIADGRSTPGAVGKNDVEVRVR